MKLIILPGWQHSSTEWQAVQKELRARSIDVTVLDLPGFGSEPYQPDLRTLDDIVTWCHEKLAVLTHGDQFVLCGHSYGGRVAAKLAVQNFPGLTTLVLVGSPNIYRPSLGTQFKTSLATILRPVKHLIPEHVKRSLRSTDFQSVRGTQLEELFQNIIRDDQTDVLRQITITTTLLWGEHDDAAPLSLAKEMQHTLSNAELDVILAAGHNVHIEKPALLAAKLANICQASSRT